MLPLLCAVLKVCSTNRLNEKIFFEFEFDKFLSCVILRNFLLMIHSCIRIRLFGKILYSKVQQEFCFDC